MSEDGKELARLFAQIPTAAITGQLYKKYGMRTRAIGGVQPLDGANCRFVGPAFTMRYVPQREDLNASADLGSPTSIVLKATEQIVAGDVLVMDMQGDSYVGGLGDVLVTGFIGRGVAGLVADGGMRDVRELRAMSSRFSAAAPPLPRVRRR